MKEGRDGVAGVSQHDPYEHCRLLGYYPFSKYLRERFGCKVSKVSLHAGFTCPNRDGTRGFGGCAYCVNESFSPAAGRPIRPVAEQMAEGIASLRRRRKARKFFAYFQSFTNTYDSPERLRERYDAAVGFADVVGLSIGTRPDCVPEEVLDVVESYSDRLEVWLEFGLQSAHDRTLERINRGHDFATFVDAVERTSRRRINICVHVILGLPGETEEDMMATARALQALPIRGLKLHHLSVVRGTRMEEDYRAGKVRVLSAAEYVRVACDFLERVSPRVTVQRVVGETIGAGMLVAPRWPESKATVLRMITDEFRRRGAMQGARVELGASADAGAVAV